MTDRTAATCHTDSNAVLELRAMNRTDFRLRPTLCVTAAMGSLLLASCSAARMSESAMRAPSAPAAGNAAKQSTTDAIAPPAAASDLLPKSQPQLVKTASLSLTLASLEQGVAAIETIVQQQQGDILQLEDQTPSSTKTHHQVSLALRVPQSRLDATLQALKALGTVDRQSITAEDVSDQLVDYQARLRNLRRSEAALLQIMERSGSVGDVLKVAQELSTVRSSIEQLDAQLHSLQNRVAYASVRLTLTAATATAPVQRSTNLQLQDTWSSATHSLGKFTVDLLQLGIWLLVYSPYWLILGGLAIWAHSKLRPQAPASVSHAEPPTAQD